MDEAVSNGVERGRESEAASRATTGMARDARKASIGQTILVFGIKDRVIKARFCSC